MANITNRTSVKQLKEMGITLEDLHSLIARAQRKQNREQVSAERITFIEEVFTLMSANVEQEWKNGKILKHWYPNGKSANEEEEKARKSKHAEISRALQSLVDDGRIVKQNKTNTASGTFYTIAQPEGENTDSIENEETE